MQQRSLTDITCFKKSKHYRTKHLVCKPHIRHILLTQFGNHLYDIPHTLSLETVRTTHLIYLVWKPYIRFTPYT